MVRFSYAKDPKSAAKSAQSALIVAPQALFEKAKLPKLFTPKLQRLILDLASDVKPGDNGSLASSLSGTKPRRIFVGVLPDEVSRYNCEARTQAIEHVVSAAHLDKDKQSLIILILEDQEHIVPALNAVGRAFPEFCLKSGTKAQARVQIAMVDPRGSPMRVPAFAKEVMAAARSSAELIDTPPTDMNPEALADAAMKMLTLEGVKIREIVGEGLLAEKLLGIHSVGRCALSEPRMVVATYTPPEATKTHVALVGKGVTYDTGGLHIKSRGSMETMKADMGGAAAVLGAFRVLVRSGCPHPISLVMCLAENAIGPDSYKPDDVILMHSGKTVEINNTDAEGRLLLADGVSYAARVLKASYILDAATLTGAQMIATGVNHAAIMSNDADLEDLVVDSAYASGDLVHPLPFAPELFQAEFKSCVADMKNSVKNRANAQSSCAGQFVYSHIADTSASWCHVDLAGPSFRGERGTGFGVALLAETVLQLEVD